jgi:hypothetical protein
MDTLWVNFADSEEFCVEAANCKKARSSTRALLVAATVLERILMEVQSILYK